MSSTPLENVLDTVTIAWIWLKWRHSADVKSKKKMIAILDNKLARHSTRNKHYLEDVVHLACNLRSEISDFPPYVQPAITNYSLAVDDDTANMVASTVKKRSYNTLNTNIYVWTCRANSPPLINLIYETENFLIPNIVLMFKNFSADCKFKVTGDLFIHSILKLKLPAWLGAGICQKETPYSLVSKVFESSTNATVQPLVQTRPQDLIDQLKTTELFVLLAALAIELATAEPIILVNSEVCAANPDVPTLCVVADCGSSWTASGVSNIYGFALHGVFFYHDDPYVCVSKWVEKFSPSSSFAQFCVKEDSGNPLTKFL